MSEDKVFAEGFSFKRNDNAPEFVVGRLSIKVDEAIAFIKKNEKSNWVNLSVKKARSGNYYLELDTFEPKKKEDEEKSVDSKKTKPKEKTSTKVDSDDELPF
jgi:hypothetical protein